MKSTDGSEGLGDVHADEWAGEDVPTFRPAYARHLPPSAHRVLRKGKVNAVRV